MSRELEQSVRAWLGARDPGPAPERLRAAVLDGASALRPPLFPAIEEIRARFRWASTPMRLGVLAILLLSVAVAVVAAALLLRNPYKPEGLIAYKTPGGMGPIRVVAADGKRDRALTFGDHDKSPRWSPDGRSLLYLRFTPSPSPSQCGDQISIVIHQLELGTERVLATLPFIFPKAEWSASGGQVAIFGAGNECELAGFGLIDVASARLTMSDAGDGATWFFWTGDSIDFLFPDHLGRIDAAALDGDAAPETILTFDIGQLGIPSPDGRYVALSSEPRSEMPQPVQVVDMVDGSRIDLGPGFVASWSPDGSSIAFVQSAFPESAAGPAVDRLVVTVGAERRLRVLADVAGDVGWPLHGLSWTADGRGIFWSDAGGGHVVEVATGRVADLVPILRVAADVQWQPVR